MSHGELPHDSSVLGVLSATNLHHWKLLELIVFFVLRPLTKVNDLIFERNIAVRHQHSDWLGLVSDTEVMELDVRS